MPSTFLKILRNALLQEAKASVSTFLAVSVTIVGGGNVM